MVPSSEYRQKKRGSVFQKVDISAIDFSHKIPSNIKTKEQLNEILPLLQKSFLTKNLCEQELTKLAGAMKPQIFFKNELIIKYGDVGKEYFILSKGSVKVIVYEKGTDPNDPDLKNKVQFSKIMGAGSGFGELALLYNDKRSATIEAIETCETYTLDGTIFKTVIIKSSIQKRSLQAGFLNDIKLFGKYIFIFSNLFSYRCSRQVPKIEIGGRSPDTLVK